MKFHRLLVANRGEIAIRIMRAAAEMNLHTVGVYPEDDAQSLHVKKCDESVMLKGVGPSAYLDMDQILAAAKKTSCTAIHPGYGFLSENAQFAARCESENILFVGPRSELLELFGNKLKARAVAQKHQVPVLKGTSEDTSIAQARQFFQSLPKGTAMMVKAVAGGGGRCIKEVHHFDDIESAIEKCRYEAGEAYGNHELYVEELIPWARHIEVQILGDGSGEITHLGERECSIQRRHQKLIEIAPSPNLPEPLRRNIINAAVVMARETKYNNVGTFEFLVDAHRMDDENAFAFIEVNPRLQVEHTVTEEVHGLDIVRFQLQLAGGMTLSEMRLHQDEVPQPRGFAIQVRVNMETLDKDGSLQPAGGILKTFEIPSGAGIRTDTFGYGNYQTSSRYDSLLAKVICHSPSPQFSDAVNKIYRALGEFRIEGVSTNIPFLQSLLKHPDVKDGKFTTRFIEDHKSELLLDHKDDHRRYYFEQTMDLKLAGVRVDEKDPLAVLVHGKKDGQLAGDEAAQSYFNDIHDREEILESDGTLAVKAKIQGTIWKINIVVGDPVSVGQEILIMEAMKMEHEVKSPVNGIVRKITVDVGDSVYAGHPLVLIEVLVSEKTFEDEIDQVDLEMIRQDLKEIHERQGAKLDENRPNAVGRRRKTSQRTARENLEDLCDPGSFVEYGGLVLPVGIRRPLKEMVERYPGDGIYTGIGSVNGNLFDETTSRCAVLTYDYTVLAGTQGALNHRKTDRILEVAERYRIPVVFFTEGGGGRAGAGSTSTPTREEASAPVIGGGTAGLDIPTWHTMSKLSGLVPTVGITSGYCFAGNAVLLGCCDVIIATANARIGIGGPAMVEGGGLGVFHPDEIGPMSVQVPNGVVDVAVRDEAEAVAVARQYLSYFQGPVKHWEARDQRALRHVIPENRLRVYDIRKLIDIMADKDSFLELRKYFGKGIITALIRIQGKPMGLIANNPAFLSGAIDSDGSDKAARFMQLCDAFDLPIVFLCDTPGIMVGPESEKTALVRHSARMFVTGANLTVPIVTVVLRKAYGLGAMTMGGGHFKNPAMTVAWPTGEFGPMGLEGQVKLGFRDYLAALEDPDERTRKYEELVNFAYQRGKAINIAVSFGLDDVIDPADTRKVISGVFDSVRTEKRSGGKKRPLVDPW
ncbi:MAG: carbamoyl-phosphate synthase large subunit [Desulfobacteraceae bacterium]|nr:carbamoyl-phosphate synthase large subunit [Pseudomonadota bacterium]MCG2750949.1 carbamoyl-phosphate synthase large subunit [Desulfobacteraceae bacterium]